MKGRIKVNGKTGNLENNVTVECVKSTVTITSDIPFSKRLVFYNCIVHKISEMVYVIHFQCSIFYCIHGNNWDLLVSIWLRYIGVR